MYQSPFIRSTRAAAVLAALAVSLAAVAAPAATEPVKCRRAIAKNAADFEAARLKALQKCNDKLLKGKVAACPDTKASEKIAKALAKLNDKIGKACGGLTLADMGFAGLASECTGGYRAGQACDVAADCPGICVGGSRDGDPCTTAGFCSGGTCAGIQQCDPVHKCPSVQNDAIGSPAHLDCYAPLTDEASVAQCVACVGAGTVDQLIDTYYGTTTPPSADKDVLKCQRAVGKAAAKHFAAVRKALQKCADGVLKNGSGSCPDGKASEKIAKSVSKVLDKITTACTAELLSSGFVVSQLVGASGRPDPACATVSSAPADIAAALECLTAATAEANHALGVGTSPASANATCGNSKLDAGETCDDGNQLQESGIGAADFCPSDCAVAACTPAGSQTVTVSFASAVDLTGMTVVLYYDESTVSIPGQNSDAPVQAAVSSASFAMTPVDTGYALRNVLVDPFVLGVPAGEAFTVTFETCQGAPAPVAADFHCFVADASDAALAPVAGASCTVSVP